MLWWLVVSCSQEATDTTPPDEDDPTDDSDDTDPPTSADPLELTDVSATLHAEFGSLAVVSWTQSDTAEVHVESTFEDDVWRSSPVHTREAGSHTELVVGVPYAPPVTWHVVATRGGETLTTADQTTTTAEAPAAAPVVFRVDGDPALYDAAAAPYFLVGKPEVGWNQGPWSVVIIDRQGRVVWAWRTPLDRTAMHARVAQDGRSLLLDHNSYWGDFDDGAGSTIERTLLDGTVLHTYATPGLHHPFTDLPDGSIAYGAAVGAFGENEQIVIVHDDGTQETVFDCRNWLDETSPTDECASNTLTYDATTERFLFSMYMFSTLLEIDRFTGEVTRWWGEANSPWTFDPADSQFQWQHGGHITAEGTVLTSTDREGANPGAIETVAREYTIDDGTQTLHEFASWGVGEGLYGSIMGEAYHLPNGNLIHNYGGLARIREFTPDGTVVWDVSWQMPTVGRTMPIADLYDLLP